MVKINLIKKNTGKWFWNLLAVENIKEYLYIEYSDNKNQLNKQHKYDTVYVSSNTKRHT